MSDFILETKQFLMVYLTTQETIDNEFQALKILGQKIRQARIRENFSQSILANKIGLSKAQVAALEYGILPLKIIRPENLRRIGKSLHDDDLKGLANSLDICSSDFVNALIKPK